MRATREPHDKYDDEKEIVPTYLYFALYEYKGEYVPVRYQSGHVVEYETIEDAEYGAKHEAKFRHGITHPQILIKPVKFDDLRRYNTTAHGSRRMPNKHDEIEPRRLSDIYTTSGAKGVYDYLKGMDRKKKSSKTKPKRKVVKKSPVKCKCK